MASLPLPSRLVLPLSAFPCFLVGATQPREEWGYKKKRKPCICVRRNSQSLGTTLHGDGGTVSRVHDARIQNRHGPSPLACDTAVGKHDLAASPLSLINLVHRYRGFTTPSVVETENAKPSLWCHSHFGYQVPKQNPQASEI